STHWTCAHDTISLHVALPISEAVQVVAVLLLGLTRPSSAVPRQPVSAAPTDGPRNVSPLTICPILDDLVLVVGADAVDAPAPPRSEEHTSELQSREKLVCRLL